MIIIIEKCVRCVSLILFSMVKTHTIHFDTNLRAWYARDWRILRRLTAGNSTNTWILRWHRRWLTRYTRTLRWLGRRPIRDWWILRWLRMNSCEKLCCNKRNAWDVYHNFGIQWICIWIQRQYVFGITNLRARYSRETRVHAWLWCWPMWNWWILRWLRMNSCEKLCLL